MNDFSKVCKHGQLARVCGLCESYETVTKLQDELSMLREDARRASKRIGELQAENERLNKLVAAQHGAMRTEWKDLIAERDKYKAEAETWKQIAQERLEEWEKLL